jgi:predicted RNA-binding protein with EMAP domain
MILALIFLIFLYYPDRGNLSRNKEYFKPEDQYTYFEVVDLLTNNSLEDLANMDTITMTKDRSTMIMQDFIDNLDNDEIKYLSDTLNSLPRFRGSYAYHKGMLYVWCEKDQRFEPVIDSLKGCRTCKANANVKLFKPIINEYRFNNSQT